MKIYTRTGDGGDTGLPGQARMRKHDPRIEACGAVDELNAALGVAVLKAPDDLQALLCDIQGRLFVVGALLCDARGPSGEKAAELGLLPDHVARLEQIIDRHEAALPPLRAFLLPGGSEAGAQLHLARAVCRRAERRIVALAERQAVLPVVLAYLNRLSDLLFVLARLSDRRAGAAERLWEGTAGPSPDTREECDHG